MAQVKSKLQNSRLAFGAKYSNRSYKFLVRRRGQDLVSVVTNLVDSLLLLTNMLVITVFLNDH